tara:strand:- start:400 stop:588 length:189 start_codon:yes stop_codon:yes gene_type:complete
MRKNINKINPIVLIVGAALIMFFSYFLFFSPMAQCKTALKKKSPNTTKDNLVLVCQELLKKK